MKARTGEQRAAFIANAAAQRTGVVLSITATAQLAAYIAALETAAGMAPPRATGPAMGEGG